MQVTLTKTLENAVKFANFCREYNISPTKLGELIQIYKEEKSCKGWEKSQRYRHEIVERLALLGFEDISFYNADDKLTFTHPSNGDKLHLPEI